MKYRNACQLSPLTLHRTDVASSYKLADKPFVYFRDNFSGRLFVLSRTRDTALVHWFFQKALRSQPSLPVGSLPLLAPHDPLEKLQALNLCQARSQPVFSGKPGMISRDHFVCPVPSFSEMKEMDEEKCYGFRKTGKLGLTWLTGSYAPSCCWIL